MTNAYIHSTYVRNNNSDAVIVSEKNIETNKKQFKIIEDCLRPFWVTKPALQTYTDKREYAHDNELDEYRVKNIEMPRKLAEVLGQGYGKYFNLKKLCDSPFVYGADINAEVLVKMDYMKKQKDLTVPYTVGSLDIETSVLGGKEVILITFIDQHRTIYTSIFKPFLKEMPLEEALKIVDNKLNEFYNKIPKQLLDRINKKPFKHNFFCSSSEIEIIEWIFKRIHESEVDFVTIWNMGFDIPYLLDRIRFRQRTPEQVMCHPDIPTHLRKAEWYDDTAKLAHITDRWDWFYLTAHAQFIDAMCLYSRIRKVKGRDISYRLDYISKLILGIGKLDLGNSNNHYTLQTDHFAEYIAYNIVDVILMVMMEEVNNDIETLCELIGNSVLQDFNKQTVQLKNMFYTYCRERNCVPGTVGSNMTMPYDVLIPSSGGAVLSPKLARGTGVAILEEYSGETALHKGVLDIDVSSQYPSTDAAFNIAKETKLATCLDIEGFGIPHIPLNQAIISLMDTRGKQASTMLNDIYTFIMGNNDPKLEKVLNRPVHFNNKSYSLKTIIIAYAKSNKYTKDIDEAITNLLKTKAILGEESVGDFYTNIASPVENSVYLCNKYFGLPDYTEMEQLLSQ